MPQNSHIVLKGMQPQSEIESKHKFNDQQQQVSTTSTTRNTTTTTAATTRAKPTESPSTRAAIAQNASKRSPAVKVIKCSSPLCNFKFYLDIRDHQLTKRIEEQIKLLGGSLEFFLTSSVTHFITDKPLIAPPATAVNSNPNINSQNPATPQTPLTPHTPYSLECLADSTKSNNGFTSKRPIRNSRADAILNRARRQSTINVSSPTTSQPPKSIDSIGDPAKTFCSLKRQDNPISNDIGTSTLPYVIWQCENAIRFFKKVQNELKDYLGHSNKTKHKSYAIEPTNLKSGFIKFESIKRNYRPYYHLFKKPQEWPKIQLTREDGAFRLSPKKDLPVKELKVIGKIPEAFNGVVSIDTMTRKSRTKSSQNQNLKNKGRDLAKSPANSQKHSGRCKNQTTQHQKDSSDKQCGVCEICKIEYDALTIHLKTKDHEYFAKNSQNFMALDSLIHTSADVNKFLDENRKLDMKTELEEMEVEHEGLIVVEQDPLQNSENENDGDYDNDAEEDDEDDDQSQMSSSTNKRKSVEPKMFSPTLREKSKRSTKGKHSSEKFQNCTLTSTTRAPKTPSPQKITAALDVKTNITKRKPASSAVLSPPIRAMLPPSSMYKVVETLTDVNCTPPRGKCAAAGLKGGANVVGSPSIIVKFKKVRHTELDVLNGEAENFMFPKKRNDSSELPTDVDRQTTSDRVQRTQSSQQLLSSSSSSEEQDPEEEFEAKRKPPHGTLHGKKAIVKAKRRLSKKCSSSTHKPTSAEECKQSFPKTPIQPIEQLKSERNPTTATTARTKRRTLPKSQSSLATKGRNVTAAVTVSNKIVLPEATRKSSRTATAIVTAATTSTRLLQAAVEAAKSKNKLETSIKSKLPPFLPIAARNLASKRHKIKQEIFSNSEQDEENVDGNDMLNKPKSRSKTLRCSRKSVMKMEDRMGDRIKKPQNSLNARKLTHGFDADDYDDDDEITMDDEEEDDDKDEDFIVQSPKTRNKQSSKSITLKPKRHVSPAASKTVQTCVPAFKPLMKSRLSAQTLTNITVREERLARRQSRLITQLQLELQTASEDETCKETPKPKNVEKKTGKSPTKTRNKSVTPKKSPMKATSPIKQREPSPPKAPSRYFDYTKSERIKAIRYAFERLPAADLWYRVYKRQDNHEEKYFEYFGSTKYRKLPYELGPIPFDSTLMDYNRHKISCKLCENVRLKKECDKTKKLHVRRELQLDLKSEPIESLNQTNALESQDHSYSSSSRHDKQHHHEVLANPGNYQDLDEKHSKLNCSSHTSETKSYAHKHKKLHLLQRYRQELEQQEQLQRQKLEEQIKCRRLADVATEIKTEDTTHDSLLSRNDRAGSAHSNASSCSSSTHTNCKSKKMRNKLLDKVSFLANLELPPRKSPREHASTLALVSCIIKQRQDSLSKTNSETDEPPVTPTETEPKILMMAAEKLKKSSCEELEKERPKTPSPLPARVASLESPLPNVTNSPRTRSQAATPIEELRFATEISETVKRMRRGRNKYDYSPPFVKRTSTRPASARGRGKGTSSSVVNLFGSTRRAITTSTLASTSTRQRSNTPNIRKQIHATAASNPVARGRRRKGRQKALHNKPKSPTNVLTSIRKTGSKKGVLEFEVDNVAIDALKKATTDYVNPKLLEWQIDKFLTLSNKQYEHEILVDAANGSTPSEHDADNKVPTSARPENTASSVDDIILNTPPATDYFSSDFDLCDIINQSSDRLHEDGDSAGHLDRRIKKFSIFNTVHLNKYYRKRKNPKTNRTGWPKAPKKKAITRQQSMKDKIYFLQNGTIREEKCENNISMQDVASHSNGKAFQDDTTQERKRENGAITPPDSENCSDDNDKRLKLTNDDDEESLLMEEDSQMGFNEDDSQTAIGDDDDEEEENFEDALEDEIVDGARIIEEDEETLADTLDEEEEHREPKADSDADADIEEGDEDERNSIRDKIQNKCVDKKINRKKIIPRIIENDDEDSYEPQEKRTCVLQQNHLAEKVETNLLNPNSIYTTTPATPFLRALRRTPLLNGSLGSCISPSEKAGDNSDIFTVSSDGLDTDMDLSNSQSQLRSANVDDDDHHHQSHHHHHSSSLHHNASTSNILTTRRKFDISKYAPTNAVTCAAEAATAAVKSLAISQFLKKEVRVTCRRLRAPFRRFRYRR